MDYEEIKKQALSCKKCELSKTRTNVVFGDGPTDAKVLIIGEAPGRNEDLQGSPFVGKAGNFLNELLEIAGLKREEVFITNIVKCRPPNNRDPTNNEIDTCYPYLNFQINHIKPKAIIGLGRHASNIIFERYKLPFQGISKEHGVHHTISNLFGEMKVIAMYHPAASIYRQELKEVLKDDFRKIKKVLK